MICLNEPSDKKLQEYLDLQSTLEHPYTVVGATLTGEVPSHYTFDKNSVQIGKGESDFQKGIAAFRAWKMFEPEGNWVLLRPHNAPIQKGTCVSPLVRVFGLWVVSAARIVYTIDEPRRFGFAYGTLPDHAEEGEEQFLIDWREDDSVWYVLTAFSRPRHPLAGLFYPLTRRLQRRFARQSLEAMKNALSS